MSIPFKHFYMIRHGETEHNAANLCAGSIDTPLTTKGRQQASKLIPIIQKLKNKPNLIAHTDLSRSKDTATIINEALNLPLKEIPELREQNRGDYENICLDEYKILLPKKIPPPNGESFQAVEERTQSALKKLLTNDDMRPLIVSHLGIFRAFGGIYNMKCHATKNCELYEFEPNPKNTEFPWRTWHYSIEEKKIQQKEVLIYNGKWV